MRPRSLLTQVLAVNLLLIAAAVVGAALASNPGAQPRDEGATGLVLGFALAATIAVNLFLLSRRVRPLEQLADEMERADLTRPAEAPTEPLSGPEEVERLDRSFRQMLARLEAEQRRRASAALEAQERERARVARDLHDEVNQALTGLILRLEALRTKAPAELSGELAETGALASRAMEELLSLARQLRPAALDDLGLEAALAELTAGVGRQSGLSIAFEPEGALNDLSGENQLVVYRVVQEALSNAVRHAEAAHLRVRVARHPDRLELRVTDDGKGFDVSRSREGLGVAGMRERALLVGGALELESHPGLGTRVRLVVPLADEGAEMDGARSDG
jgi:two-component system, NarL family, sensor histidine kinase UhpB